MSKKAKAYLRRNGTIVEIAILFIGLVFVLLGRESAVMAGIGSSLIASSITVFLADIMLGKWDEDGATEWGLANVYRTRGEMNSVCDEYLQKAKKIDIIAFGMKSFRDTQQNQIRRMLSAGGDIRIITMEPECDALKMREKDELLTENGISGTIRQLIAWARKENQRGSRGKIEVRFHSHLPQEFMFMMDNRLFVGPYEYGKGSQQSISFEYNNQGKAYRYYEEEFYRLWNDPDFCDDALQEAAGNTCRE